MSIHIRVKRKRFTKAGLSALLAALKCGSASQKATDPVFLVEQEIPPDFLKNLYYGQFDPLDWVDADAMHAFNVRIIAHQELMRKTLPADMLELVDQYGELLDDRGTAEREQAFAAGFSCATALFAAGLVRPVAHHAQGDNKDGNRS